MQKKAGFLIMSYKGFYVLRKFIEKYGNRSVEFVVSEKDNNVKEDFFENISTICKDNHIKFFKRNEEQAYLKYLSNNNVIFVIGWKWIIEPFENIVILHDSLLPKYRGFAPLVNMLINGEREIGVSAIFPTESYDKGDIILQKSKTISYPIKIFDAIKIVSELYFDIVDSIFSLIINNQYLPRIKQEEQLATYSPWLDYEDYFIDWRWDSSFIKRFIDATGYPYDNAKTFVENNIIKIIDAVEVEDVKIENRNRHIGKVIFFQNGNPVVVCGKGLIMLTDMRYLDDRPFKLSKFRVRFKSNAI